MNIIDLPKKIAVFPLSNAVFFPKTVLPLNIFEDRYIQLVTDCMQSKRLFGMIQPKKKERNYLNIYKVGCLGKITSFNETNDKRFIINLSGIIRFRIVEELKTTKLYREFKVDYTDFSEDLKIIKNEDLQYDKTSLLKKIKTYFKRKDYIININELEKLNFDQLINTLCMISPLTVEEKQKLIETNSIKEKIKIFENIINFSLVDNFENTTIQ